MADGGIRLGQPPFLFGIERSVPTQTHHQQADLAARRMERLVTRTVFPFFFRIPEQASALGQLELGEFAERIETSRFRQAVARRCEVLQVEFQEAQHEKYGRIAAFRGNATREVFQRLGGFSLQPQEAREADAELWMLHAKLPEPLDFDARGGKVADLDQLGRQSEPQSIRILSGQGRIECAAVRGHGVRGSLAADMQ